MNVDEQRKTLEQLLDETRDLVESARHLSDLADDLNASFAPDPDEKSLREALKQNNQYRIVSYIVRDVEKVGEMLANCVKRAKDLLEELPRSDY